MLVRKLEITKAKKQLLTNKETESVSFSKRALILVAAVKCGLDAEPDRRRLDGAFSSNHPVQPPLIGAGMACLRHRYPRDRVIGYL